MCDQVKLCIQAEISTSCSTCHAGWVYETRLKMRLQSESGGPIGFAADARLGVTCPRCKYVTFSSVNTGYGT